MKEWRTHQLTIHCLSIRRSSTPPEWPFSTARTSARTVPSASSPSPSPAPPPEAEGGTAHKSHTHTEQSLEPLTMNPLLAFPSSGADSPDAPPTSQSLSNFKHSTLPACPANVATHRPLRTLHTLIERSREPVMIRLLSNSRQ